MTEAKFTEWDKICETATTAVQLTSDPDPGQVFHKFLASDQRSL